MLHADVRARARQYVERFGATRMSSVEVALWLLLVALIIQMHLPSPNSDRLPYAMLALAVCGLATATLLNTGPGVQEPAFKSDSRLASRGFPHWTLIGAAAGVICGIVGGRTVGSDPWSAQWWWLAAVTLPLVTLLIARVSGRSDLSVRRLSLSRMTLVEMAILFVIAMTVRSIDITSSPPFLLGDEAQCGLFGRLFNEGHTPLLSISWYGLPMVSYAISGLGLRIFGDDFTGLRMINAVVGSIGVVLTYQLGKEWFSRRAGIVAAVILSFAFLHLELSRDGIHYIQGPTCITLTMLLCTMWIRRGGHLTALLAGMSLILDVQVYWSARIVFFLVPVMFALVLLTDRPLLVSRWREIGWMAVGALAAGLPILGLFAANPGSFNGHQGDVSIFSSAIDTRNHLISQYGHVSNLSILIQQIWKVLTAFNSRGDASIIFDVWGKPMLDTVSAALFPAALGLALLRWRRWEYLTCLAWIGLVTGASAITIDPPLWGRFASIMPAIALLLGALLAELWQRLETRVWRSWLISAGVAGVLLAIAFSNVRGAFDEYPSAALQTRMEATDVGRFLATAPGASETVMLSDGSIFVNYEPIRFLAPQAHGCTLMQGQPLRQCPVAQRSKLFVILPGRERDLAWLEKQRPGGRVIHLATYSFGTDHLLAYELS